MANALYTPTHCPSTGRKYTRAERTANNKLKLQAINAAKQASRQAPKPMSLREAIELVNGAAERHFTQGTDASKQALEQAKANLRNVEAAKAPKRKQAPKHTGGQFTLDFDAAPPKRKQVSKQAQEVASNLAKLEVNTRKALMRMTKAQLVDMILEDKPTPTPPSKPKRKQASKPKRKSAPKARKATPAQRVADRQERAHHGRPDTPVTPQAQAHTADVEAARKAARETGARNRRRQAFDLATMWAFSTSHGGVYTQGQQAELTRLLGSTDVSTYEDVVALTH